MHNQLLASISAQPVVNLQLFQDDPSETSGMNQQAVLEHTVSVIQHLQSMQSSALQMCLHLYLLRQEFDCCQSRSDQFWSKYCQENFSKYGLSDSGVRAAVRTGKSLARLSQNGEASGLDALAGLSRAALIAFGEATPEVQDRLITEIEEATEARNGKGPTAKEINNRIEELSAHLAEKDESIKTKNDALHRMNTALNAREQEAAQLRDEVAKLHRKLDNQAQAVVHQLPPGVKDAKEYLAQVENQLSRSKDELARVEGDIAKHKEDIQRSMKDEQRKAYAKNALTELENDIRNLSMKYTDVLIEKIRAADKTTIHNLEHIANKLRAMADTLAPSLL